MKGKRNLGKAVVLGLLLSTGVYGAVWAEDIQKGNGELWGETWNPNPTVIEAGDNLIVTTTGQNVGIGYNGTVNVRDGNLTVNSGYNAVESGYIPDAKVQIWANNVAFNADANGIFTATVGGYKSTVTIGSEDRKIQGLTINAGGQGIDNKKGNVYIYGSNDSQIYIQSNGTSGDNRIQSAINNECNGEIVITGGNITVETPDEHTRYWGSGITNSWSDGGTVTLNANNIGIKVNAYGINNHTGETTLNSNHVSIDAQEHGIMNTSGTVSLNTKGSNSIISQKHGIHTLASANIGGTINIIASENYNANVGNNSLKAQEGYDNIIFGKVQGIHSEYDSTINVIADNNNIIAGGSAYSIYDENKSDNPDQEDSINIIAGNNNYIGYRVKGENQLSSTGSRGIYVYHEKIAKLILLLLQEKPIFMVAARVYQ